MNQSFPDKTSIILIVIKLAKLAAVFLLLFTVTGCSFFSSMPDPTGMKERLAVFPTEELPLNGPVTIYWDEHQIPFIDASDDRDLPFIIGLVHAHLRLGQMELFRRASQGRLSEMAGPIAGKIDHTLRIIHFGRAADGIIRSMPADTRSWLESFVRGVNHYQNTMRELPHEFRVFGIEPEPWTLKDLVTMSRLFATDVNWLSWFSFSKLMGEPNWKEFWKKMAEEGSDSKPSFTARGYTSSPGDVMGTILMTMSRSGSNSLVLSPGRTENGTAIMANDPHLGLSIPNFWILIGYRSPSYHAVGFTIPGLPFIALGRNRDISWGGTNMRSASSSLYDISDLPEAELAERKEKVRVRWFSDKKITVRESRYGPVISDAPLLKFPKDRTIAIRWMGHEVSDEFTTFLKVNRARNWDEFREAYRTYAVSGQNFLYADDKGNIGQLLAVRLPSRGSGVPDSLIQNREAMDREWKRLLGPLDLPSVLNPEQGFLVSSNNRPVKAQTPVGYFYSSNDRVMRLSELITGNNPVSMDEVKAIQRDVYSINSARLKDLITATVKRLEMEESLKRKNSDMYQSLLSWDGHYRATSRGALAFQLMAYHLVLNYYSERYSSDMAEFVINTDRAVSILIHELETLGDNELKSLITKSFTRASGRFKRYGTWGGMHRLAVQHLFGNIPVLGKKYRFAVHPADGFATTVAKTSFRLSDEKHVTTYGANSRHISVMSDPDENYFVLLGGQDGWLNSGNFLDQVPLWLEGKYLKIPLEIESVKKKFNHKMVLAGKNTDKNR